MFTYHTRVRLEHTDATGVLFFPQQLTLAMEAFEEFLCSKDFSLKKLMDSSFLLPVVHVESTYLAPLRVADRLEIRLMVQKLGTSSITLKYSFFDPDRQLEVGKVGVVHVAVDRVSFSSVPIPEILKRILHSGCEG